MGSGWAGLDQMWLEHGVAGAGSDVVGVGGAGSDVVGVGGAGSDVVVARSDVV